MSRTASESHVDQYIVTEDDAKGLPTILDEAQQLTVAQAAVMGAFDVAKAIGRIEAAQFMETVSEKLIVETAINVRESKQYKGFPFVRDGKTETISTFDEFCEVFLGKTGRRIRDLISNYNQLGPDLYEQAEKIGFRQRDYNALKALPADDRALIAQAIEEESLDKALEIMQEMAAKNVRDKEAMSKQLDELAKDNQSKDAVIKQKIDVNNKKDDEIIGLQTELANMRRDLPIYAHVQWPEAFQGYIHQLAVTRKNLKQALASLEVIRAEAMALTPDSAEEENSLNVAKELLAKELIGIQNEAADILEGLAITFDKSLGLYADDRLELIRRATGITDDE